MYDIHWFFCVNQREAGHSLGCCASKGADDLLVYAKQAFKQRGLVRARVNRAGCLGQCRFGIAVVVYPHGQWFQVRTTADVDQIVAYLCGEQSCPQALVLPAEVC